jgi:hypothetical protein
MSEKRERRFKMNKGAQFHRALAEFQLAAKRSMWLR